MDAQQFLAEFGHVVSAPDGMQRLREMVLALATQGRLVPQNVYEENALKLYKKIQLEKDRLIAAGIIKRTKQWSESGNIQKPFNIPKNWSWLSITDVFYSISPSSNKILSSKILKTGKYPVVDQGKSHIAGYTDEENLVIKIPGPVVVFGDHTTELKLIDFDFVAGADGIKILRPLLLNERYFYWYLKGLKIEDKGYSRHYKFLINNLFPLPPLAEQARIVAKVDELMALCDKLEVLQQERQKLCVLTRALVYELLINSEATHDFTESWQRTQFNLSLLLDSPTAIDELKDVIRELTVRGAFAKAGEESATQLLAEIIKCKTGKRFAKLTTANEAFELPHGWRWVMFEDLLSGSESGWSPKCDSEPRTKNDWGVLKVSAVTWGSFRPEENKRLPLSLEPRPEFEVKGGDFLLSRANTAELIARSVIVPTDCPPKLMMSDKIVRLKFLDNRLKAWVNLVNNSNWARRYYKANATGTSDSMRNVSRPVIHELVIPFPPLPLQEKLLEALTRLEEHCDLLKSQMTDAHKVAKNLATAATAAIASITGIRTEEVEKMKAPKTDLVSKLRIGTTPTTKEQAPLASILVHHNNEMEARDLWQRYGGEIDAFYQQLKIEVEKGWIVEPEEAQMREVEAG